MSRPAIQLYSVRDIDEPLPNIVRRVAAAGFEGVEFANRFPDADARAVADALADTGVEAVAAHVDLQEIERDPEAVADRYATVGCDRLVIPHLPMAHYRTPSRVDRLARRLDALGARLADHGAELVYHNQSHDFVPMKQPGALDRLLTAVHPRARDASTLQTGLGLAGDRLHERLTSRPTGVPIGRTAFGRLVSTTDPETLSFELDVGGVAGAGRNPIDVLEFVGDRAPLVHLKDVVADDPAPLADVASVEPGTGLLDVGAILRAVEEGDHEWVVYEHDDPADPIATIRNGAEALIGRVGAPANDR